MLNVNKFWETAQKTESCWLWSGSITRVGYPQVGVNYKSVLAHRLAYELIKGQIPESLVIDHLCKNKLCINPNHLEAVTQKENVMRSDGIASVNARKVVCKYGHNDFKSVGKQRQCKICNKLRMRKYRDEGRYE